jgi:peptidyl-prolyl cis-trans isomerase C
MVKKHTRLQCIVLIAALSAVVQAAGGCSEETHPGIKKATAFPDSVVGGEYLAWVNHHPIKGSELRVFTLMYRAGTVDSLMDRAFNLRMLDGLIDRTLLWQEGVALGLTVDDSTTQWYIREFVKSVGGIETFDEHVEEAGITRFDVEQLIKKDLVVKNFLEINIASGTQVNDSIARIYYNARPQEFVTEDSVRARHILLRSSPGETEAEKAEKMRILRDLRDRFMAGEDFATLAREYSQGPSGPNGGDLGYFARRDMVASFSEAAFALERGRVSDVVQTEYGYHIILVVDKIPARALAYEEVRSDLMRQIEQYLVQERLRNHLQRSRAAAIIERNY